jgi:hypothetical protein
MSDILYVAEIFKPHLPQINANLPIQKNIDVSMVEKL